MTSRDFCYWLQGAFELGLLENPTKEQMQLVKKHLNLVFKHEIDPSMGDEDHQSELNEIHNEKPKSEKKVKQNKAGSGPFMMRC